MAPGHTNFAHLRLMLLDTQNLRTIGVIERQDANDGAPRFERGIRANDIHEGGEILVGRLFWEANQIFG